MLENSSKDDAVELFEDAIEQQEFKEFCQALQKLSLHMLLSANPITWSKTSGFDYRCFKKNDFYCIDGFPKEDLPCVVCFLPPMINKGKHVYQGIKPAVITLSDAPDEIKAFIASLENRHTPEKQKQ